jgi:hypothetical protein
MPNGQLTTLSAEGTVNDFAESHKTGTYLVCCGKTYSNHILCIIDGDIYDSWDSKNLNCYKIYKISETQSKLYTFDSQKDELKQYALAIIHELIKKYNFRYGALACTDDSDFYTSDFAFSLTLNYMLSDINIKTGTDLVEPIEFTFSPRRTVEENKKIIYKLCKTTITRLAKNIQKYIDEYEDPVAYENLFEYDRANIYYKLPVWSQKLLIKADQYFSWFHGERIYELEFQPLFADKNQENIVIKERTVTDIKRALELYRKTFTRPDYE